MAKRRKYNLLKVKGLMIVSQILLLGFVGYWLYTQYQDEKVQLRKNVIQAFEITQRQVTDTAIFVKIFGDEDGEMNPLFAGRTFRTSGPTFSVTLGDTAFNDDEEFSKSINKLKRLKDLTGKDSAKTIKQITFRSNKNQRWTTSKKTGSPDTFNIHKGKGLDSELTKALATQGLKLMLSEIVRIVGDTVDKKLFDLDTNLIKKSFRKAINKNGYNVDATLVVNYKDHIPNKQADEIYVENSFFGHTYGMAITNYRPQLIKDIAPQIFFTLFLLALTLTAFLFTYRSLKEQIKLGVIKNDFISNMSHELKTPISTVKVAIEALTSYNMLQDPVKTRDYLEMAAIEMDRLDMLVSQALNASLIEGGRITLKKEPHDLQQIAEGVCKAMQLRFEQNNARVTIDVTGSDFVASVDKLHIQGVLINLLDNSLKYADKELEINIHLSKTAGDIKITIADNGPGIPKEYIDKVFDKFFRVPTGDRHNVKGFGLGLSYSQQIMAQHQGSINVYNKPEGGCIFILIIPKTI